LRDDRKDLRQAKQEGDRKKFKEELKEYRHDCRELKQDKKELRRDKRQLHKQIRHDRRKHARRKGSNSENRLDFCPPLLAILLSLSWGRGILFSNTSKQIG
jgi:hypothetical protein